MDVIMTTSLTVEADQFVMNAMPIVEELTIQLSNLQILHADMNLIAMENPMVTTQTHTAVRDSLCARVEMHSQNIVLLVYFMILVWMSVAGSGMWIVEADLHVINAWESAKLLDLIVNLQ